MRRLLAGLAIALGMAAGPAVLAMAPGATAAPVAHAAAAHTAERAAIPFVNTNEDIKVHSNQIDAGSFVQSQGGNVPYTVNNSSSTTDFSEVNCQSAGGKDWCYLKDSNGHCMNVPTTGTYAFFVVPSSCPSNFTPEEWARTAEGGGWTYENRHTGLRMSLTCAIVCYQLDVDQSGGAFIWDLPQS